MVKKKLNIVFIFLLVGALFLIVTNQDIFPFTVVDSESSGETTIEVGDTNGGVDKGGFNNDILFLIIIIALFFYITRKKRRR